MLQFAYAGPMLGAMALFVLTKRCFASPGTGLSALPTRQRLTINIAAFIGGVLGAKLPFVFVRGADWFGAAWLADGKTVTTGLMGAYIGVELAKLWLGVAIKTGDSFALPLAFALAVGQQGCFFHGCCCGVPTDLPWGIDFGDGVRRHPIQIYESLFHFVMAARAASARSVRVAPQPAVEALPHLLWRLPVPHRIHPTGTRIRPRAHLLPVGGCGTDSGSVGAVAL